MVEEDYEIVSHKEISRLKQQISDLREGEIAGSANNIMKKLDMMLDLFKEASLSIKNEKPISEEMRLIDERLEEIIDQNKKIAEGILAIADLVKSEKQGVKEVESVTEKEVIGPQHEVDKTADSRKPVGFGGPAPIPQQGPPPFPRQAKPEMPPLNPPEAPGRTSINTMPGLPPLPPKKRLFR